MTLYEGLESLYEKYGYYLETLKTLTLTGIDGAAKIKKLMSHFRHSEFPIKVKKMLDYTEGIDGLPKSDVLKFFIEDGWFAVRPSGTEPKIKFYFGICSSDKESTEKKLKELISTIDAFIESAK